MWPALIIIVVLIVIVWWLLNQNAKGTQDDSHAVHDPVVDDSEDFAASEAERVENVDVKSPGETGEEIDEPVEDDLAIIEGIGPKIKSILNEAGIKTFSALAEKKPDELKTLLTDAGLRLGDPTTWPDQAKLAASGDTEALEKMQEQLKGGRVVSD